MEYILIQKKNWDKFIAHMATTNSWNHSWFLQYKSQTNVFPFSNHQSMLLEFFNSSFFPRDQSSTLEKLAIILTFFFFLCLDIFFLFFLKCILLVFHISILNCYRITSILITSHYYHIHNISRLTCKNLAILISLLFEV